MSRTTSEHVTTQTIKYGEHVEITQECHYICSRFGEYEDVEMHLWSASGLPCRSSFRGGKKEMKDDRWVTWEVEVRCSNVKCKRVGRIELAYPCLRMPTSWSRNGGELVNMRGVGDAMQRVILQQTTQTTVCACKKGKESRTIVPESISLPALLVVSMEANQRGNWQSRDEVVRIGNLEYEMVGVAFNRPGHYTCSWRLGTRWFYYDDLDSEMGQCEAGYVPRGYTRRLIYYVLTGGQNRKFDGIAASKQAGYTPSEEGGVWQQEGTEVM